MTQTTDPEPMSREWNYHPDLPLANPSVFRWPPDPGFLGRWLVRNLLMLSERVMMVLLALLCWWLLYPSLETAVQSMKLDAVDYLKKPFNPEEFRVVVDRVMRKKGLLRSPEENLHRVIGETIRGLRKDRNLTLKQMARRTGLSVSLLSQIERAESSASVSSLYKIANALDVRIIELFGDF